MSSPTQVGERGQREGPAKYVGLKNALREKIVNGSIPVGSRLPSMRQLGEEYGMSLPTVFRGIQELAREGFVSPQAGRRGTTVVRREPAPNAKAHTLACLLRPHRPRNPMDNFALDMIQGVRDEISARRYRFIYHCIDEADYENRVLEAVHEPWVCGALCDQRVPGHVINRLARQGRPIAMFNREENIPGLITVCPDYHCIGRETFRTLIAKGYRRWAMLWTAEPGPAAADGSDALEFPNRAMCEGFCAESVAQGLDPGRMLLLGDGVRDGIARSNPEAFDLPRRKPADWEPLGVFAATDTRALRFLMAVAETDLVIGRDIGVIGCYDLVGPRRSATPPTTWRIDAHAVGATAVRELIRKTEEPERSVAPIRVPAEYVDRGTA